MYKRKGIMSGLLKLKFNMLNFDMVPEVFCSFENFRTFSMKNYF